MRTISVPTEKGKVMGMRKCKACGRDFASTNKTEEICYVCLGALKLLNGYAVPVVRCKDCKHYQYVEGGKPLCEWHRIACAYDDFCSRGERKDNG